MGLQSGKKDGRRIGRQGATFPGLAGCGAGAVSHRLSRRFLGGEPLAPAACSGRPACGHLRRNRRNFGVRPAWRRWVCPGEGHPIDAADRVMVCEAGETIRDLLAVVIIRGLDGRPRCDEWVMVELQPARAAGISGGLSGPAGVDWPEPLAKWVLEPAACVLPCTRVPPTTPDGARPPPHFRGNTSGPRLPLPSLKPPISPVSGNFLRFASDIVTLFQSRLFDNPRFQHRGAGVCARAV